MCTNLRALKCGRHTRTNEMRAGEIRTVVLIRNNTDLQKTKLFRVYVAHANIRTQGKAEKTKLENEHIKFCMEKNRQFPREIAVD